MDYFQGVVAEYLRANRATFVNPEFMLQLNAAEKEPAKGSSWYVDLLAVSFEKKTAYLCEVTYSKSLAALLKRHTDWVTHWPALCAALHRDSCIPEDWSIRPWVFIPEGIVEKFIKRMPKLPVVPIVTPLEMTLPWRYSTWNRIGEAPKPLAIPPEMQS